MIPWETLDRAVAPDGTVLTLLRHDGDFSIRADGRALMGSRMHASEDALGARGCEGLAPRARVLLGGLGMGFSLRATLDALGPDARVEVVELVPAVARWNREHFGHLAGNPLDDPRVTLIERDVVDVIARAKTPWDAVLLDVDNGPTAFTSRGNTRLYDREGLRRIHRALREGGAFALWSVGEDPRFTNALTQTGFYVRTERVRARELSGGVHILWIARRLAGSHR